MHTKFILKSTAIHSMQSKKCDSNCWHLFFGQCAGCVCFVWEFQMGQRSGALSTETPYDSEFQSNGVCWHAIVWNDVHSYLFHHWSSLCWTEHMHEIRMLARFIDMSFVHMCKMGNEARARLAFIICIHNRWDSLSREKWREKTQISK